MTPEEFKDANNGVGIVADLVGLDLKAPFTMQKRILLSKNHTEEIISRSEYIQGMR